MTQPARQWTIIDHLGNILEQTELDTDWHDVRKHRDQALKDSDWRAVKDRVLPNPWKDYRTFLRSLPQNYDSANDAADAWAAYDIPE